MNRLAPVFDTLAAGVDAEPRTTGEAARPRPPRRAGSTAALLPINVLASSSYRRFSSRDRDDCGDKLLSARREQFGGHAERTA